MHKFIVRLNSPFQVSEESCNRPGHRIPPPGGIASSDGLLARHDLLARLKEKLPESSKVNSVLGSWVHYFWCGTIPIAPCFDISPFFLYYCS